MLFQTNLVGKYLLRASAYLKLQALIEAYQVLQNILKLSLALQNQRYLYETCNKTYCYKNKTVDVSNW